MTKSSRNCGIHHQPFADKSQLRSSNSVRDNVRLSTRCIEPPSFWMSRLSSHSEGNQRSARIKKKKIADPETETGGKKLGTRTTDEYLVGYSNSGYQMMNPTTRKVSASCDVTFFEHETYKLFKEKTTQKFNAEEIILNNNNTIDNNHTDPYIVEVEIHEAEIPTTDHELIAYGAFTQACVALSPLNNTFRKDEQKLSNFIPRTYQEATTCKFASQWIEAIESEFQSHEQNDTWSLVQLPTLNRNILNTKWVFTVKISDDGQERAKARLVAVGCGDKNSY